MDGLSQARRAEVLAVRVYTWLWDKNFVWVVSFALTVGRRST